jgi:sialidase-1
MRFGLLNFALLLRTQSVLGVVLLATLLIPTQQSLGQQSPGQDKLSKPQLLFESGNDGYPRYRIPALLVAPDHTLLAFCEGRKDGRGLTGNIDLVLKRSHDNGKTWRDLTTIFDHGSDTLGNPCVLWDPAKKRIWLAFTRSPGQFSEAQIVKGEATSSTRVFISHSDNSGTSWSAAREITSDVKSNDWNWYGTGPGTGLALGDGRLLFPAYHVNKADQVYRSHTIFSDDHGKTWKLGKTVGDNTSEAHVAERSDGSLVMDTRTVVGKEQRTWATSSDCGLTWSKPRYNELLFDPHCQGCLYRWPTKLDGKTVWLFTNPVGPKRHNLTLRASFDEGRTWPRSRLIQAGDSQYSSLAKLSNGQIGCLYERWVNGNYHIFFNQIPIESLISKRSKE